jgi:pilus assembly protein CpaF
VTPDVDRMDRTTSGAFDPGLARRLRADVASRMALQPATIRPAATSDRAETARRAIAEALDAERRAALNAGRAPLSEAEEQAAAQAVFAGLLGLGGFQQYLDDETVETVNANGCDQVFVQRTGGERVRVPPVADSDEELVELVRAVAARTGMEERRFDRGSPRASVALDGGGRLFAVMGVTGRPCVSIRRDRLAAAGLRDLVRNGTLDRDLADFLAAVVRARKNIVISGGTSSGKTTLMRALASAIAPHERIITIEDSTELQLDRDTTAHPDVVAMQAREPNTEGEGEVALGELVRWALRMTPDRVIVGEVRGSELIPMLNAMSQGNDGSMTTIHASSSRGAMLKMAAYAAQSPEHLTLEDTNLLIASAVHFVIQLAWDNRGRRCVSSIREVTDADGRQVVSNEVYRPGPDRRAVPSVPVRADTMEELVLAGYRHPRRAS